VLVTEAAEVAAICEAISGASLAAFDLEFLTADRLIPRLCVVQVAWLKASVPLDAPVEEIVAATPEVRLIDALAVDPTPVFEALAAHPRTVVHAGRQDLAIIGRLGIAMPDLIDTQVMAAFAGIGDQVGLGSLTSELLGFSLAKEQQWTDWAKRPLSEAQVAYAIADVGHLHAIYALLAGKLGPRLPWALAESSVVAADALAAATLGPEEAWRGIGGLRGLDPLALAVVHELAAWRFRVAHELDKPLGWVLTEKLVIDLARSRPTEPGKILALKGLPQPARQRVEEIAEMIGSARPRDGGPAMSRGVSARAQRWSELLLAIVQLAAEQSGVTARLLATRSDAEEAARLIDEQGLEAARSLPAFSTWRYELIGKLWEGFLTGALGLVGDPTANVGMRLAPVY
jgi:ribonuclease D